MRLGSRYRRGWVAAVNHPWGETARLEPRICEYVGLGRVRRIARLVEANRVC